MSDLPKTPRPVSLTPRQHECLEFIQRYLATRGCAPSLEEMRVALGCGSKSSIHRLLVGLEARGRIRRLPRWARALEVLRPESRYPTWEEGGPIVCESMAEAVRARLARIHVASKFGGDIRRHALRLKHLEGDMSPPEATFGRHEATSGATSEATSGPG